MRIIATDGVSLAALLGVAHKIQETLVNHNVALGVGYIDGEDTPVAVITALGPTPGIGVTIERNPRIASLGDDG